MPNYSLLVKKIGFNYHSYKDTLVIELGGTTSDKKFTLAEVEYSGACVNAPVDVFSTSNNNVFLYRYGSIDLEG